MSAINNSLQTPAGMPQPRGNNRHLVAPMISSIGVCLCIIGVVGIVVAMIFGGPLMVSTIVAITLTEVVKSYALTLVGKIVLLSVVSLLAGGICLKIADRH